MRAILDVNSPTWEVVREHALVAIEGAARQLEQPALGGVETEHLRGQIRAMRGVLALAEPKPKLPDEDAGRFSRENAGY